MKRVTLFKVVKKGFPVNITGFIVRRDILLVFYLGVLGVAFEMHKMRLLSSYTENDAQ